MRFPAAFLFSASLACAQTFGPSFEVASVTANKSGPASSSGFFPSPGRLRVTNTTLAQLIQAAWHVKTGMLFGITGWMESERFDIDAKAPGNSSFDEDAVMLRGLLAERFQLKFHHETREIRVHALRLGRDGPKFQASRDQNQKERVNIRSTEIAGFAIPFGHFVTILEAQLGYPVINETGLSGKYDLALEYVRDDSFDVDGPSVFAALGELGLKLETRRVSAEVFVIDSAALPLGN